MRASNTINSPPRIFSWIVCITASLFFIYIAFLASILIFYFPHTLIGLAIAFFTLGFLSGTQTLSYSLVSESNPLYLVSTSLAFVLVTVNLGGALVQTIFGEIMNMLKYGTTVDGLPIFSTYDYQVAFTLMPLVFFISFFLVICLKEPAI